ncbi:TPA: hypothetical protein ACH3X1_014718 [Trebouxia sp. C0004]
MKSKQRVHWIPAGYGNFKVMPAFQQSFSSRALLWSWMGSVVDKPERFEMVELMRNADAKITDKGLLLVFDVMGGQGSKSPTDYSPILYDTKFVPLPAGTSPEHFRYITLEEWSKLPQLLATLQESGQSRFGDWQAHNNRKWAAVKETISDTVAEQVAWMQRNLGGCWEGSCLDVLHQVEQIRPGFLAELGAVKNASGKQTRASSESLAGLSAGLASGMTQGQLPESADVVSQSELSPYHKELLEELTAFATGAGEDCMDGSYVFA